MMVVTVYVQNNIHNGYIADELFTRICSIHLTIEKTLNRLAILSLYSNGNCNGLPSQIPRVHRASHQSRPAIQRKDPLYTSDRMPRLMLHSIYPSNPAFEQDQMLGFGL